MRRLTKPVRKAINTGSVSKYPMNEKTPMIKHTIAIISRRRGGFDVLISGFVRVEVFEVIPFDETLDVLFFLLVCAIRNSISRLMK